MNAQAITMNYQQEVPPMRVVRNDMKVFDIRYLETLNLITVVGWSITDDAWIKYCQMLADIELHLRKKESLNVYFKLNLFNTSSTGYLFKIIKRLNKAHSDGKEVKIYWSCAISDHEEEILQAGLDFRELCDFKFNLSYA